MGRIFVTGDTHRTHDIGKVDEFARINPDLTEEDVLIIAGDFGVVWDAQQTAEEFNIVSRYNHYPFTTLWIDGNHDNHDRIPYLPQVEMFGDYVGKLGESVFHLRRGRVYTINDKKFWVMGGGFSIDKARRINHVSWWSQELPSYTEMIEGKETLEKYDWTVDHIVTHTCPKNIFPELVRSIGGGEYIEAKGAEEEHELQNYFQYIWDKASFKSWYFGHFHQDVSFHDGKFNCIYNIVEEVV